MPSGRNILLSPVGSAGDNFPFIGIGAELARRGHRVTVATTGHFEPLVRAVGLHYVETGTDDEYHAAITNPNLWHPLRGFQNVMTLLGEQVQRLFPIQMRMRQEDPNLIIVCHSLDFAARALFHKYNTAVVCIHLQPMILRTLHQMPTMSGSLNPSFLPRFLKRFFWWFCDAAIIDRAARPVANAPRKELGLDPIDHPLADYMNAGRIGIGLWPDWYAPAQPDYAANFHQTGFPLWEGAAAQPVPAEVQRFLDAGEAPIVVTPGSANVFAHGIFGAVAESARRLGRRAMLLSRHRDHVPPRLPEGVAHFDFAPLTQILPRCAALIHHGGIGTTAAALASGVPQVIFPLSHDQPDNAARIQRLGVGARLAPNWFTAKRLSKRLAPLLESSEVHQRCQAIRAKCQQQDAMARTCDLIENLG